VLPVFGQLLLALLPVPLVVYGLRRGRMAGAVLLAAAFGLVGLLIGPQEGVVFLLEFAPLAIMLAEGFRRNYCKESLIFGGLLVTLISSLVLTGLIFMTSDISIKEFIYTQIEQQSHQLEQVYQQAPADLPERELFDQAIQSMKELLWLAYPGMYISLLLILVVANYLISRLVLLKLGQVVADQTPFILLLIPDVWIWGAIAAGVLWIIKVPLLEILGLNLTLVFAAIYFLQGLATSLFFARRMRFPFLLQVLVMTVLLIQPIFLLVIVAVGLFDMWFDFRKLKVEHS